MPKGKSIEAEIVKFRLINEPVHGSGVVPCLSAHIKLAGRHRRYVTRIIIVRLYRFSTIDDVSRHFGGLHMHLTYPRPVIKGDSSVLLLSHTIN